MIFERGRAGRSRAWSSTASPRPARRREVLEAIAAADAIVIGPSNPVISIGPILAVPGHARGDRRRGAPVVAVSPFVGGHSREGPDRGFLPLGGACR